MSVTLADVMAALDVVSQMLNECDSMTVDEALAMHDLIGQLGSEVKRAESMLETQAKQLLEGGGRQIDDRMYGVQRTGKWRFRHDDLAEAIRVQALSVDKTSGEQRSAREAVDVAIALMREAYVSNSTEPKKGLLAKLGFTDTPQIADWERTGTKLVVTDLSAPEETE